MDAQTGVVSLSPAAQMSSPIVAQLLVKNAAGQDSQPLQLKLDCAGATGPITVGCACDSNPGALLLALLALPALAWRTRRRARSR